MFFMKREFNGHDFIFNHIKKLNLDLEIFFLFNFISSY
jgi:hypothetical protein